MSTVSDNNDNTSIKDDTNAFSELITSVRDVRDNANTFLESLAKFDNIRREVNVRSLNNFIQGILYTDYNEVEEVVAIGTTTVTTRKTSPIFHAESFSESSSAISRTLPQIVTETTPDITSTKSPTTNSTSISPSTDFSPQVVLEDVSDANTTTTTNSTTIATSTASSMRSGRPHKFSNRSAAIIDQVMTTISDRRSPSIAGSSRNTGNCYSDDTSDRSDQSGSVGASSLEDDSHFERVMNLVRAYIGTTESDVLKDGVYTWKNTRPIIVNEHLARVKKFFRNNNTPSAPNEDEDIVSAFKRIHTSRRSMYLTRKKNGHANPSSSKSAVNVVSNVGNRRGRPLKSSKGKQRMR